MHFISKRAVILGVVASLGFAGTAQAASDTDTTSVTLSAGALAVTSPLFDNFDSTALTGASAQHVADVSGWTVGNPGNDDGWEVSMSASPLVDVRTADLGVDDVTMTGAVLSVDASTPSPDDVANDSGDPVTAGGDISTGARKVADAAAADGMGDWNLAQGADNLTLDTPASAREGSYTSTITTTIATSL
ncbi:MAG: hypothetical protein QOE31_280 [Solirubrobacteraceae bacterium]|jgi:hypothetical protein|nr:hypothetical protein [Solirubrobacteraceae bacterium]